ncbi:hypothetical protein GW17_00032962 [Ensete ventricosum]|nr:hypothetical protein GW17_00032962 [Ensete ventricosum]
MPDPRWSGDTHLYIPVTLNRNKKKKKEEEKTVKEEEEEEEEEEEDEKQKHRGVCSKWLGYGVCFDSWADHGSGVKCQALLRSSRAIESCTA